MRTARIFLALIISAAVCLAGCAHAEETNDIYGLVSHFKRETRCASVSVAVFERGEASYYGDSGALYQIGSMTKAFTGLAVQKMIAEGKISEDGSVSDYIPGFEAIYDSEAADISVGDLLAQTSGYTNNEKDYPTASEDMTLSEWAADISGRPLAHRPGTEYAYSNVNYNLLGLIIENASGLPYKEYMEREILAPLGLDDTFVGTPDDTRIAEGRRLGYRHSFEFPVKVREAAIPAGYFYSNAEDMERWAELWTGSTEPPESLREAFSAAKLRLNREGDYYSGWELFAEGVTGHSGGTPNYSSRIAFSEEKQIGVCVLCDLNVAASTDSLCSSIFDAVSGKGSGALSTDIWTVFDIVFTGVTAAGLILFAAVLRTRKKAVLTAIVVSLGVLLALILILFPIIFGAGLAAIIMTWAPWSLAGGLAVTAADIVTGSIRLIGIYHEDNNKTGEGQASDRHNRIPRIHRLRRRTDTADRQHG